MIPLIYRTQNKKIQMNKQNKNKLIDTYNTLVDIRERGMGRGR